MEKVNIAKELINYWHIVEFLDQQLFPKDIKYNINNVKLSQQGKEITAPMLNIFKTIPFDKEINNLIKDDNEVHRKFLTLGDNFHICIGNVKKELIIKDLYDCLKIQDLRPEESTGEICLMAFKVDCSGVYIKNSLRISPLIWGVSKLIKNRGVINNELSEDSYKRELKTYEDKLYDKKMIDLILPITNTNMEKIFDDINGEYIKSKFKNLCNIEFDGIFSYHRYKDEESKLNNEDKEENISELSKGFYTSDLEMIKNSLDIEKHCSDNDDFINYIVSLYEDETNISSDKKSERIDIRINKEEIEKWLDIRRAPLGKWPSKYNPSLMQQIAINMSVSDLESGNIFSVNGPPGTGKTTLLKEVIASNIVERAKLLCTYEESDDAFEEHNFKYGSFSKNGYDKYCNKYHAFKDEKISEYGMLVASCNNSAVENITKELPDGLSLLSGLEPDSDECIENIKELSEVSDLFDIKKNLNTEEYTIFNKAKKKYDKVVINDIYFSYLSHKLINNKNKDINEWGLISAPMGKFNNISNVYKFVLKEFNDNFLKYKDTIEKRKESYTEARIKFKQQLYKVKDIRVNLSCIYKLIEEYMEEQLLIKELENKKSQKSESKRNIETGISNISEEVNSKNKEK